jgi:ribosome-associated protein|nr:MAG TPA: ATP-dependent RNA helicase [Caudoviricetes sp.]
MLRVIEEDTRQQAGKHEAKREWFAAHGFEVVRTKLYVGDYRFVGGVRCVDTKCSIAELAADIDQQHDRFRRELKNARGAGYELTVLVENEDGVRDLDGLAAWAEPAASFAKRKHAKRRISGLRLAKACMTMSDRYGVSWAFCSPEEAGAKVIEILTGGAGHERS